MTRGLFVAGALLILALAGLLRGVWLTSDPPTTPAVGVVWHDEGAWVHNARNRALWGVWRTDRWNPMFLAPVFTGLEYGAFEAFGVGTWQARVVPILSGLVAIAFLIAGLNASAGPRAALLGGTLLATNYVFAMWNRAALMESTMTSFIVVSWAAYAMAGRRAAWGFVAGVAGVLAFFTKASAAFFLAAIVLEAASRVTATARALRTADRSSAVSWTLGGLVASAVLIGLLFVLPHWTEVRFYNWEMSVERKPQYSVHAFMINASWLPLVHDFFMWAWPVLVAASIAMVRTVSTWRTARPADRLLVLWVMVGLTELIVHDSGNERRYVMFMPALIALAAGLLVGALDSPALNQTAASSSRWRSALAVLALGYLVVGSGVRLITLEQVRAGNLHLTVWVAAAGAAIASMAILAQWGRIEPWLIRARPPVLLVTGAVALTLAADLGHFLEWARTRQAQNYLASVEVGRLLAPGTLVQGKLANGLSLENQIRPIFIGHGFGNYDDRLERDDVRYILTYVAPSVGFESQARSDMIPQLLDHYPRRRIIATLPVNETGGPDRVALIDKLPGSDPRAPD